MRDLTVDEINMVSGGDWGAFWGSVTETVGTFFSGLMHDISSWFNTNVSSTAPVPSNLVPSIQQVCQPGSQVTATWTGSEMSVSSVAGKVTVTVQQGGGSFSCRMAQP